MSNLKHFEGQTYNILGMPEAERLFKKGATIVVFYPADSISVIMDELDFITPDADNLPLGILIEDCTNLKQLKPTWRKRNLLFTWYCC